MDRPVRLLICGNFRGEALAALSAGDWHGVRVDFFPAACGKRALSERDLAACAGGIDDGEEGLIVGSACLAQVGHLDGPLSRFGLLRQELCFHMVAGRDLVHSYTASGAYLVTPGWLADWRENVARWGDPEAVRAMFAESVSRLLLLDTGVDPRSRAHLADMSAWIGRPAEALPVGIDFFRMFLQNEIGRLRLKRRGAPPIDVPEPEPARAADYAMALELLGDIPRTEREEAVITRIADLFKMLFSTGYFRILTIVEGRPGPLWSSPPLPDAAEVRQELEAFDLPFEMLEDRQGFRLRVGSSEGTLAVIEAGGISFPEHLPRYLNLALGLVKLIVLALQNARVFEQREKLLAELQGALGNVKRLSGLLPICANCKKIRDDQGYWQQVETYIAEHSQADFTHGICPDCMDILYPGASKRIRRSKKGGGEGLPGDDTE